MNFEVALRLSGLLFCLIIITNVASERFGYISLNDVGPETKLQRISGSPGKFKTGVILILIEHLGIIALAVMLFIALSPYDPILAIIWTVSRTVEGLIQIYFKKKYWRLLDLARRYSVAGDSEKDAVIESARLILKTKSSIFSFSQLLFVVGTLAYLVVFIIRGVAPVFIGWFGIVAAILYGLGNGMTFVKPDSTVLLKAGGLLILLLELVLGGWLIFTPTIIP